MSKNIEIQFAIFDDLSSWMDLVNLLKMNFPGLHTEKLLVAYRETVIKNINRQTAICAKDNNSVVGILLFSKNQNMLCCMGVHPDYRRLGIADCLIEKMLDNLPSNCDVIVTTFRKDDKKGVAPRSLYKKKGFIEDELCYEFDYPHQKFILKREIKK